MKKTIIFFTLLLFMLINLSAQENSMHKYDRVGISVVHITYNDQYDRDIENFYNNYRPDNRYDYNILSFNKLSAGSNRTFSKVSGSETRYNTRIFEEIQLSKVLNDHNAGKDVIAFLFNRKDNGLMNVELLAQRGLYNATDEEYHIGQASKLGINMLKDSGEDLINNSYIVIFDHINIRYEYRKDLGSSDGEYYYLGTTIGYLYQIEWSEDLLSRFYEECWIDESTPEAEIPAKLEAYNNFKVPVKQVYVTKKENYNISTEIEAVKRNSFHSKKSYTPAQLKEMAFVEFLQTGINGCFHYLEDSNDDFKLKTTVYKTRPIRAKIGKKEGLKKDNAFYVYENIQRTDNSISQKRVGVIRATNKIANNMSVTKGDTETSQFYQYAGGRVEEGQSITEKKLGAMALEVGGATGQGGGLSIALEGDSYSGKNTQVFYGLFGNINVTGLNIGGMLGYGYRANNFHLFPLIGVGYDMMDFETEDDEGKGAWFGRIGVKTNINIVFPVQFFVQAGFNFLVLTGDAYAAKYEGYREIGGAYINLGLRYCF